MQKMVRPSSVEELRAEVARHFTYIAANAERFRTTPEDASLDVELAGALLEHALSVPIGDMVDLWGWLASTPWAERRKALFGMTAYFCGAVRVLNLEFHHETLGQLPYDVVNTLVADPTKTIPFNGVELTPVNVLVKFRRDNPFV